MRLAKHLAHAGVASRRGAEELIAAGRVTVDGVVVRDPASDVTGDEEIAFDGEPVGAKPPRLVVYAVNKPPGVVSTAKDTHGRPTVVDLVHAPGLRLYPVGRLDADTEGLLLLTNDGELAHRLTHPSFGVDKEYLAEVEGRPSPAALRRLREGVALDDGVTAPARVSLPEPNLVRIVIHEGRNRQVRRMCEAVGHPVTRLVRTRIGPVAERSLRPGRWRHLGASEVRALADAAGGSPT
jgi:23S rRNA pseudouridine2605 synthase